MLPTLLNAMNHMQKALIWIHNPEMYRAFLLGTRLIKPRRIVYYNSELVAAFKEWELIREQEADAKQELCSKRKVRKHKKKPGPVPK